MQIGDFELYIFDWDGTLSTSSFFVRISRFFKSRYNVEYIKRNEATYRSRTYREMRSIRISEGVESLSSFIFDIYARISRIKLKSGTEELLKLLKSRGKKIAIFSDGKGVRLLNEIRRMGIAEYFNIIVSADTIKEFKPSPIGLRLIAKELGVSVKKCVYIGDMSVDVMTARFAGMASCTVADGFQRYEDLKKLEPNFIFRNLGEMIKQLELERKKH